MSLLNPYSVSVALAVFFAALAYFRPHTARLVIGIFFLVMALGVNLGVTLTDPGLFAAAGSRALLPFYRWFFSEVLARWPLPFALALIVFETIVGGLILGKGRAVRLGLSAAVLFCLLLTPVGVEELTAPLLTVSFFLLLRHNFPQPAFHRSAAARAG